MQITSTKKILGCNIVNTKKDRTNVNYPWPIRDQVPGFLGIHTIPTAYFPPPSNQSADARALTEVKE